MRKSLFVFSVALVMGYTFAACNCGGPKPANDDGGIPDGGNYDGGPGSTCLTTGTSCSTTSGGVCCSGVCNGSACATPTFCGAPGTACSVNTDCCSNHCLNGQCSSQQCLDVGTACTGSSDCCTATCTSGSCATIPGSTSTCKVIGQACSSGADCCSTNCQGGVCVRAYSCQATGDVCLRNSDCCGNVCSANDGGAGVCIAISGGGGGGCIQDGNPCSGGTNCCSRVCVDLGSGATVCQPVDGCRLTGDFCLSTNACCGGGINPNGTVTCRPDAVGSGRCDQGNACNGVGNICGQPHLLDGGSALYPDGGVIIVNAPQDCCDGHKQVCRLDNSGVPRCFGGGSTTCPAGYTGQSPCCIADNAPCQFSGQCCNGVLCLPGAGGFFCTPSTSTCKQIGASCTPSANDCCAGTSCLLAGELGGYACQPPSPGGGSDAGSDAGPTCAANGSTCTGAASCCSQVCVAGVCQPPGTCQALGGVCTASSDCCSGLACNVPGGSTTGTCQPSSCPALGQGCSVRNACCTGLRCINTALNLCTASDPSCTCAAAIN